MEEKILIKSKNGFQLLYMTVNLFLILAFILFVGMFCFWIQDDFEDLLFFTTPPFFAFIVLLIIRLNISKCELVVSDKRIYGKANFGKRVDLPLDSISAVGTSNLGGINVSTSSGYIKFKLIKNNYEIHSVISDLIMNRQNNKNNNVTIPQSSADELKKYKELLDSGILTQEEFDAKKKQLLGL